MMKEHDDASDDALPANSFLMMNDNAEISLSQFLLPPGIHQALQYRVSVARAQHHGGLGGRISPLAGHTFVIERYIMYCTSPGHARLLSYSLLVHIVHAFVVVHAMAMRYLLAGW
jgi:hypothetical protein